MTLVPLETEVSIVKRSEDARWQILLSYENGMFSLSRKIFETEEEARQAALTWALEHHERGGDAPH